MTVRAILAAGILVAGCGGDTSTTSVPDSGPPSSRDAGPPPRSPDAGRPPSSPIGSVILHAEATGELPYLGTVFPLEGEVPRGTVVGSPDEPSLASSVLSRWSDGSAKVVVLAGTTSLTAGTRRSILLAPVPDAGTALTPARIAALVGDVTIDLGSAGSASLTDLATPEHVWWASSQVICARYRVAIDATLEAVIDVHAFGASERAFVEVVLENAKLDASAESPTAPAPTTYTATITVNGVAIASDVSTPALDEQFPSGGDSGYVTYVGGHQAFRAWYSSGWVGGDPRTAVTHPPEMMQAHPLFWRMYVPAATDYQAQYEGDAYAPWCGGRYNLPNMAGTGDQLHIGPLPQWEARYLQTGSIHVHDAVIESALCALSTNINYRDATSGLVPTHAQIEGNSYQHDNWPATMDEPTWELAHHPAVGLMAFLARPSPVFIELAQKSAIWNSSTLSNDGVLGYWAQVRGKAWGLRTLAHAIFLTPDTWADGTPSPWKAAAQQSLADNVAALHEFRTSANGALGFVWHPAPGVCGDFEQGNVGMQQPLWMHHWLVTSLHAADRAELLEGESQASLAALADWAALQPVRYVNEATAGEWRLQSYLTVVGREAVDDTSAISNLGSGIYGAATFDALPTWGEMFAWHYLDAPPPSAGTWLFIESNAASNPDYRMWSSAGSSATSVAGVGYNTHFWAALTVAVERHVPGADAAWTRVTTDLTNLDTWRTGFADEPRYNRYPRGID
jgi:hypothetical protein